MTPKEKQSHLAKVDASVKENATKALSLEDEQDDKVPRISEATDPVSCTIRSFEDTKLPECVRSSSVNACKIINFQGIANHPNQSSKRILISLSGPTTHTVQLGKNGKGLSCDGFCPQFKELAICAHTIAVAHNEGLLPEFVSSYTLPLDRLVRSSIPGGSGRKDNECGSKRKCTNYPSREVSQFGERVNVTTTEEANDESKAPYEVVFVYNMAATTCYGCKGRVRDEPLSPLPPAPYDLFISHRERRVFNRPG